MSDSNKLDLKMPKGITLTRPQIAEMLKLASRGMSLRKICLQLDITADQLHRIRKSAPKIDKALQSARDSGLDVLSDDLIDIADTYMDPLQARVKSDNIKWLLTKRKPKEYGDQININIDQKVSVSGALQEAARRSGQVIDVTPQLDGDSGGSEEEEFWSHLEKEEDDIFE